MKKTLVVVLAIMVLFSAVAIADEPTTEQKAQEVFNSLANTYDSLLFFLEQRQKTWTALLTASPKDVNPQWFMEKMYIYDEIERAAAIISFGLNNGMNADEVKGQDGLYQKLFLPLYETYGQTDEGLTKACYAFTVMIFYDDGLEKTLSEQKSSIKSMMTEAPDYAYLSNLQEFYKKTSQLMDYVKDSSDNYTMTAQRISDFQQTKREIKSDFEFVLDWPEFSYRTHEMTKTFKDIYQKYAAQKEAERKQEEEKRKLEEEKAKGKGAEEIFALLIPEGISFKNTKEECENIINNSGRKKYFGEKTFVLYDEKIGSYTAKTVRLTFAGEKATDELVRISYPLNDVNSKDSEAIKAYKAVLSILLDTCGTPKLTRADKERPECNDLKGNRIGLPSGSAYKQSDFDGIINDFSEWRISDGTNNYAILLFKKEYKAHRVYEVELFIERVE